MFPYLKEAGKAIFQDRYVKKANELLVPWDGKQAGNIGVIGVPLSKSSISHSGAAFAPQAIRQALSFYSTYSIEAGIDLADITVTDYGDIVMHPTDIVESQRRIAETVEQVVALYPESKWIALGGDHSITFPVVSGWQKQKGKIGMIQFDAHHDLRNLEDGGPTNGTPFRRLIEAGVIDGSQLVQIGLRDFANSRAYTEYGKQRGVTMYTIEEVYRLGIQTIIEKSMQMLSSVDAVYVSVDMDVLDQAFAPGCPAIGPGGMDSRTLLQAILLLARYDKVQAMDIVEIDPTIDFRQMTSRLAAWFILQFLKEKKEGDF
ncbi:formimidoylglutamase [Anoxybacillus sp. LAT_35]|uniref:formimidoylglutamase n=1 Tax=Anoxybacillus TaxID=150247 RepID=UPI001EDA4794|nr:MULTISPECIES: formimidoylglutamase [Anoxybacillus]MCG5025067.1 formimidoylglutamase [Anoxybacillus flavithermus]MCG6195969.1 formimidoylglutamase [Anoxybacillus sp. LAT_38]MCG3083596.1 formimidoylglutamase [Anoxybacillus sp. LAT27]MCG6170301.1 formimidoylglutamase [Anoxybacillus sp. LAT_11]MCG6174832.1 formimidoylglutamase [Anoxybacillus sp. LAT_31]